MQGRASRHPFQHLIHSKKLRPAALLGGIALAVVLIVAGAEADGHRPVISLDFEPDTPGVQSSTTVAPGESFQIDVVVENVTEETGAFEFYMTYQNIYLTFDGWMRGPWLGSTGRSVTCHEIITENTLRLGCNTSGPEPEGPIGEGVIARLFFTARFQGQTCMNMLLVETAEIFGHAILTDGDGGCVTIIDNTPTPTPTGTAGVATETPVSTSTPTLTASATSSSTAVSTETPTSTSTSTPTATEVATETPGATSANTPTSTSTPTATGTATATSTGTAMATSTSVPTTTATPTATATSTAVNPATSTSTATATRTSTNTPTRTSTPVATSTNTPTRTSTAVATSTRTQTPALTATAVRTSTVVPTKTAYATTTPHSTKTAYATTTPHSTGTAYATQTAVPTFTRTATAAVTRTVEPTRTVAPTRTPGDTCPRSQGYWRTHVAEWPISTMQLGSVTYGQGELLWLIRVPPKGDASLILAQQLIAAKLNVANGSADPAVGYFIDKADEVLARYGERLPFYGRPWKPGWAVMLGLAAVLDDHNNSGC